MKFHCDMAYAVESVGGGSPKKSAQGLISWDAGASGEGLEMLLSWQSPLYAKPHKVQGVFAGLAYVTTT